MMASEPEKGIAPRKSKTSRYAIACTLLASMTSVLLGYGELSLESYALLSVQSFKENVVFFIPTISLIVTSWCLIDIGVMSGAAKFIKKQFKLTDVQIELLAGLLEIYSLVGSAAAGRTSDWIGRRYTIVVAGGFFFVGALLMGFATSYAFLMVGRFVAGVGVGYAMMISPVYAAEMAPASMRGFLTSFTEVFINVGILFGYVSNYAFSKLPDHLGWRFMFGIGSVPSLFLALGVFAMPESSRWLVMQGRLGDAKKVLDMTYDSQEEARQRLADIKEAAGIPQDCIDEVVRVPKKKSQGAGVWKELFLHPSPSVRHILICAIGIHFFQQASGIDAVVLYSTRIFEKAGITSADHELLATVAVGVVKTATILVATFLLDKTGRRPLLLTSVGGMVLSLLILGSCLTAIDHSDVKLIWAIVLSVAMVLFFVASFSIGMGPMVYVYCSEIFPLRLRAQGTAVGIAVNRVMSGVLSMSFLSLYEAITIGGAFFLFGGIALVAWVFFYACFPETKGRALEDTGMLFGKLLGWRSVLKEENKRDEIELQN